MTDVDLESSMSSLPAELVPTFKTACEGIKSGDKSKEISATIEIRKILSIERNPPVELVIKAGLVPYLIRFLEYSEPLMQFEACWALTNIASSSSAHTKAIVPCIPAVLKLLRTSISDDVVEQCVWCLGNLAGDSVQLRNKLLDLGALAPLIERIKPESKLTFLRNSAWTLSNFCRGKPPPPFVQVRVALPILGRLLYSRDEEVLADVAWALSYITDGTDEQITACLEQPGLSRRLVELLVHKSDQVKTPILRTVGNCLTGADHFADMLLDQSLMVVLLSLLNHPKKSIRKESLWALSNVTAGTPTQIGRFLDSDCLPIVLQVLANGEIDLKREACWVISNITAGGNPEQLQRLVMCGSLKPLIATMAVNEVKIKAVVLEGLKNLIDQSKFFKMGSSAGGPTPRRAILLAIKNQGGLSHIVQEDMHNSTLATLVTTILNFYREEGIPFEVSFNVDKLEDDDDGDVDMISEKVSKLGVGGMN